MVKVFLEDGKSADLIAVFADEDDYNNCVNSLEDNANESGFVITESVTAESLSELLPVKSYIENRLKEVEDELSKISPRAWALRGDLVRLQEELNLILKHTL